MGRPKMYSEEETLERQRVARSKWKRNHRERINTLQNGSDGNQSECRRAKLFIRRLTNGTCECCGMKNFKRTVGHHIIPVGEEGSTDSPRNIMCLCRMCHSMFHKMFRNDRLKYQLLVKSLLSTRQPYMEIEIEKYEEKAED